MKRPIPKIKNKKHQKCLHVGNTGTVINLAYLDVDENGNKVIKCKYGTLSVRGNKLRCHNPNLIFTLRMTRTNIRNWYKKVKALLGEG